MVRFALNDYNDPQYAWLRDVGRLPGLPDGWTLEGVDTIAQQLVDLVAGDLEAIAQHLEWTDYARYPKHSVPGGSSTASRGPWKHV